MYALTDAINYSPTMLASGKLAESTQATTQLDDWLGALVEQNGSDLVLVDGATPQMVVAGNWLPMGNEPLHGEAILDAFGAVLSAEQRSTLAAERDLDFAYEIDGLGRFRINLHYQRGTPAAAIRSIPGKPPKLNTLGLPDGIETLASFTSGLVLITGGTGHGKSTTIAGLIEHINHERRAHLITIEDPIEYAFQNQQSIIEQREVGDDTPDFAVALRHILRQKPDVMVIGEMRDLETMAAALTAAETGHLVLATLHTSSASQTLARIIDVFPATQQGQVRAQMAASLRAILCQRLLPDQLNEGMVPATELMIATPAIRRVIRENETHLIYGMIETGRRVGMHTMEQSLRELVDAGRVSPTEAVAAAPDAMRLQAMIGVVADDLAASGEAK